MDVLEELRRGGAPRWRGSVYRKNRRIMVRVKDSSGGWVNRSTGLLDTPENREKARAVIEQLRAHPPAPAVPAAAWRRRNKPKSLKRTNGNRSFKRRRGEVCEVCGWAPRPPLFQSAVNAHHVRPRSEGGDDSDENRIVLCPNHHAVAHALHRERPAVDRDDLLGRLRAWEAAGSTPNAAVA